MRAELESVALLVREAITGFERTSGARDPPAALRIRVADLIEEASSRLKVIAVSSPPARRAADHIQRAREQLAEALDGRRDAAGVVVRARLAEALSIVETLLDGCPDP